MRISALTLRGNQVWPHLTTPALATGLNVFHGPSAAGKTTLADLMSHTLYGRRLAPRSDTVQPAAPEGELIVLNRGRQYRLRRTHDATAGERLTVAALDQSPVDQHTVRRLVACLSPSLLRPLYAVGFSETPRLEWLLSPEFSREYRATIRQLKWAPPTVHTELRPIYKRLRGLECKMDSLLRALDTDEARATAAKLRARRAKCRASYFLAQLTDGDFVRLQLGATPADAHVVTRSGESIAVDALWSTQRDQVYLSVCLALVSGLRQYGVRLPLVLDEPFQRLDARGSAALATALDEFTRRGHQVVLLTAQREAVERFATLGAAVHDMPSLQHITSTQAAEVAETIAPQEDSAPPRRRKRRIHPAAGHRSSDRAHREAG